MKSVIFLSALDGKWHFFLTDNSAEMSNGFKTREEAQQAWIRMKESNEFTPEMEHIV
jgi:hypothetical protein